ncbi:unnamed protein product [Discosporangium mesarthrocarpum]
MDETKNPTGEEQSDNNRADRALQIEQTVEQTNAISTEISQSQPLIGIKESPSVLLPEYKDNPKPGFIKGVEDLCERYSSLRRVRGDGNCFYRAFLFNLLEGIVAGIKGGGEAGERARAELERLRATVTKSKEMLIALGYSEVAFEMFWEAFVEELTSLPNKTPEQLQNEFLEEGGACEYLVWFCRLLTSAFLKLHSDSRFLPFLTQAEDMYSFCQREVEPMGKECEQVQIMALCEHLAIPVRIEYLDGQDFSGTLGNIVLPYLDRTGPPAVTLLYRPGHYDVLYANSQ